MPDFMGGQGGGASPQGKSPNPWAAAARIAGKSIAAAGRSETESAGKYAEHIHPVDYQDYHRGGKVRKTGLARVHKGERVIPRGKVKRVEKLMRKSKTRTKARSGR